MTREFILIDLDHTLSAAHVRDPLLDNRDPISGRIDWDAYHEALQHDEPCTDLIQILVPLHHHGFYIIGITGRPEKWRNLTMEWLIRHEVRLDELLMRPDRDYRPAPQVKIALAHSFFKPRQLTDCVAFILDDNEAVISAFKAEGVTALQVFSRRYNQN